MDIFFFIIFSLIVFGIIGMAWLQLVVAFGSTRLRRFLILAALVLPGYFLLFLHKIIPHDLWQLPYCARILCFCSLVWMLWFVIFALPFDFLHWIGVRFHWKNVRWFSWSRIAVISLCGVLLATIIAVHQSTDIRCKRYDIYSPKVPAEADGYRILLMSDLHYGTIYSDRIVALASKFINQEHPDLILHAGDLMDSRQIPDVTEQCRILSEAIDGVQDGAYGVFGNHDTYASYELSQKHHELSHIHLLGQSVLTPSAMPQPWLHLAGMDYIRNEEAADVIVAPPTVPDAFNILIKHVPVLPTNEDAANYQLMVFGHTHGGQIFPFNLYIDIRNVFRTGKFYYSPDTCSYYICQGTGFWGPPMRFFVPPEIVLFTLHHSDK